MKKIWSVVIAMMIFPIVGMNAHAYPGGLLEGRPMERCINDVTCVGATNLATDGDLSTYVELDPGSTSLDKVDWLLYDFGKEMRITGYQLYATETGGSENQWFRLWFADANGNAIYDGENMYWEPINHDGVKTPIGPIDGVAKVAVQGNYASVDIRIYEFDLFGEDVTPPTAPKKLTATAGDSEVFLSWDPNQETDLQGYLVYRNGVQLTPDPIKDTTWLDSSVTNGVTYTYTVRAVDTAGNVSDPSYPVTAKPEAPIPSERIPPAAVRALPGNQIVHVMWQEKEGASSYHVYRDGELIAVVTEPKFEDLDVENGKTYIYQVSAVTEEGVESDLSIPVRATPGDFLHFEVRPPELSSIFGTAWNFIRKFNPYIIMVLAIILIPTLVGFVLWLASRIRDRANFEKGQRYKEEAMRSLREERGPARDRIMEGLEKRDRHTGKLENVRHSRDQREYVEKTSVGDRGITRRNRDIIREHRRAREPRKPRFADRELRTARPERGARHERE